MADARRRDAERKFLADPSDPALLDAAINERRRVGQPLLDLLVARRRPARELVEPKLKLEVFARTPEGATDLFFETWGRVAVTTTSDAVGETPGRVLVPACNQWWISATPSRLTPALATTVREQLVPGLSLDDAKGLQGEELAQLEGAEALASLSLAGCFKLAGERLVHVARLPRLDTLDLMGTRLRADALEVLAAAPRLVRLSLSYSRTLEDDDLRPLAACSVEVLSLAEVKKLTDGALAHLPLTIRHLDLDAATKISGSGVAHLTQLERLSVRRSDRVSPAAIDAISQLPALRSLDLGMCIRKAAFTKRDGLAPLARLANLETLRLDGTLAVDAALPDFAALTALRELNLSDSRALTDHALARLRGHPSLEVLNVSHIHGLTPDALRHLHGLPALRSLTVSPEKGFDPALKALRAATPSLNEVERF